MRVSITAALMGAVCLCSTPPGAASAQTAGNADSLVRAAATALGAANLSMVRGLHLHLTGTAVGLPATSDVWSDTKRRAVATDLRFGIVTQKSGFDGRVAWAADGTGAVWEDGSSDGRSAALNDALRSSYALWAPGHGGATFSLAPAQSEGARHFEVLHVTVPQSQLPFDVWIDATTHLPDRIVEVASGVTTTIRYADYRTLGGLRVPYSQRVTTSDGNEVVLAVRSAAVDPPGLAAQVRKPFWDARDFSIAGGDSTVIPTHLVDNHVYLDVMLNGKGPYHFIFDSGAQNIIDPAVAREIGAVAGGSAQGGGVGSSTEAFGFAKVDSLRLGQAELKDQVFAVGPVRAGFGMGLGTPVDGLIGFEVLERFITVFDYGNARIELHLPGYAAQGRRLPFVLNSQVPQIACVVDGIPAQCSVDTGSRASVSFLSPFVAAHPQVVPANAGAAGITGFGVGGAATGRLGRLTSLEIGGYALADLVADFSTEQSGGFFISNGLAANIGGGVWKRFAVTFDYRHSTIALVPNQSFAARDSIERSGTFVIDKNGAFVLVDVRPGTPGAAAGLMKGDAIASLDGTPAAQLTLKAIRDAFSRPPGTTLHLGIVRAGASAPVDVPLTLADYV